MEHMEGATNKGGDRRDAGKWWRSGLTRAEGVVREEEREQRQWKKEEAADRE
jgi:hypothetical protein